MTPDRDWGLNPYAVRLIDRPELDAYDLIILRRVGPGQVEYLHPYAEGHAGLTDQGLDSGVALGWKWTRTEPGVRLDLDQAVCTTLPQDALSSLKHELNNVLRDEPTLADVRGRLSVTEEALAIERRRVDWMLEAGFATRPLGEVVEGQLLDSEARV